MASSLWHEGTAFDDLKQLLLLYSKVRYLGGFMPIFWHSKAISSRNHMQDSFEVSMGPITSSSDWKDATPRSLSKS